MLVGVQAQLLLFVIVVGIGLGTDARVPGIIRIQGAETVTRGTTARCAGTLVCASGRAVVAAALEAAEAVLEPATDAAGGRLDAVAGAGRVAERNKRRPRRRRELSSKKVREHVGVMGKAVKSTC